MEKLPKEPMLGLHRDSVSAAEKAFNSRRHSAQEDVSKLMKEMTISTSLTSLSVESPDACAPRLNCGSFAVLPDETLLKIMKNLDLRSLCNCCKVNRHFNKMTHDVRLYTSLHLKLYWHGFNAAALNWLTPRCRNLQRLDLSWCGTHAALEPKDAAVFIDNCGSLLTHLRLDNSLFVNDRIVAKISSTCTSLKELCLNNCTSITYRGFLSLAELRYLERLELCRTAIETATLCAVLRANAGMRYLDLGGMSIALNMDNVTMEISTSCPCLESIDCWKSKTLTQTGVRTLARCTNLREVNFGWCSHIWPWGDSLRTLFSRCTSLEKVVLSSLPNLSDYDIEPLLFCSQLQQLDLWGARSLTPNICLRILHSCPRLRMLDLSCCANLSDTRIEEWRKRFPRVSFKRVSGQTSFEGHPIENSLILGGILPGNGKTFAPIFHYKTKRL